MFLPSGLESRLWTLGLDFKLVVRGNYQNSSLEAKCTWGTFAAPIVARSVSQSDYPLFLGPRTFYGEADLAASGPSCKRNSPVEVGE